VSFAGGAAPAAGRAARSIMAGLVVPLVAGAACVLGFAPFYSWPIPIAALAALFAVWARSASPRQASLSGFTFGLGYFLAGVSWVFVSLHDFGAMPAVLAAIATFLFCAYLAVFPALAGWLAIRLGGKGAPRRLALSAAFFVATEWLRGTLFTGFPWLTVGTSQVPASPLAGFAPLAGAYGTSLAVAAVAALASAAVAGPAPTRRRAACALVAVAVIGAGAAARLAQWTHPAGAPIAVALLQGNVPQEMKWRDDVQALTLEQYRKMALDARARIAILPETALPAFLDQLPPEYLARLRDDARAQGKDVVMGAVERRFRAGGYDYFNSVVSLSAQSAPTYRKRHLVPFGEFIPVGFHWVLAILHIPLSDFDRGPRDQPPLAAGGTTFAVAICYEDVFAEEVIDALPQARALLNVSNDAWFGESFAADQHLQASQMRALETGRWMVRATNTGVTAAIDETGRVTARLPAFTAGTLVADIVPREGATPYVRAGNVPVLAIVAIAIAAALRAGRRA
jgi:apolipoprotein N-acyltransferase